MSGSLAKKNTMSGLDEDEPDVIPGRWFYIEIITNPLSPYNKLEDVPKPEPNGVRRPAYFKSFNNFVNAFDSVIKDKIPAIQKGSKAVAVKDPTEDVMVAYRIEQGDSLIALVRGVIVDLREQSIN